MNEFFAEAGLVAGYGLVGVLCFVALVLSCLSISGTWLVLLATLIASWLHWPGFPGWMMPAIFLGVCLLVELFEFMAGKWGVEKRGGSSAAGWASMGGAFLGSILGGMVLPVFGPLLGMFLGGFAAAFAVEHHRLKKADHAAHIAMGTVLARLLSMLIKVLATVLMIGVLAAGLIAE